MRGKPKNPPVRHHEPKPQAAEQENDKLLSLVTKSAQDAAQSARETAAIAKMALENEDYEELKKAITNMADSVNKMALAVENKFTPIRVVPKRDSRGVALSYDIVALKKKVH